MTESLWPLPPAWVWAEFRDVADVELELVDAKRFPNATHIAPNHIASGSGHLLGTGTVAGDHVAGPKHRFTEGQILYSKIRPYLAKAVIAPTEGFCSSDMYPVRSRVSPGFLLNWLISPAFTHRVSRDQSRTVLPKVNLATLNRLPVPVAPLNEQRRIVAKLEALQSRSRRAREALDAVPPLLEKLRQSILAAAFRGELTKDWRAKHKDVEPATVLLDRIRVERRKKWEEVELAKMKAKGKAPTDDTWKAKYKEPAPVDTTGLPALPEGWCWARVELVTTRVTDGTHQPPPTTSSGVPFIGIRNIVGWTVDWGSVDKWVAPETHRALSEACPLEPGDVLYTAVGATYGTALEVGDWLPFIFQRHIAHLKLLRRVILSSYAVGMLNSPAVFAQAQLSARGAAQPTVTLGELSRFAVPIAPIDEQRVVVKRLSILLKAAEACAQEHARLSAGIAQLDRAILAKAFRGELVPQDPNDEPADAMLARLRAADGAPKSPAPTRAKSRRGAKNVAP